MKDLKVMFWRKKRGGQPQVEPWINIWFEVTAYIDSAWQGCYVPVECFSKDFYTIVKNRNFIQLLYI